MTSLLSRDWVAQLPVINHTEAAIAEKMQVEASFTRNCLPEIDDPIKGDYSCARNVRTESGRHTNYRSLEYQTIVKKYLS